MPFRGQFGLAVLTFAGKSWTEAREDKIVELMEGASGDMPVPFKGPAVLAERPSSFTISKMPAILLYISETLDITPAAPALRALTHKVACDANDGIDELTLDGGREMWTECKWREFEPRPARWM